MSNKWDLNSVPYTLGNGQVSFFAGERRFRGLACDCPDVPLELISCGASSTTAHQHYTFTQECWLGRTDRLKRRHTYGQTRAFGAGCVQLWIHSVGPPGEHRYENLNDNNNNNKTFLSYRAAAKSLFMNLTHLNRARNPPPPPPPPDSIVV